MHRFGGMVRRSGPLKHLSRGEGEYGQELSVW